MSYKKQKFISEMDFSAIINLCIKLRKKLHEKCAFDTLVAD